MPPTQGKYSGVPTDAAAASASGDNVPIATAVASVEHPTVPGSLHGAPEAKEVSTFEMGSIDAAKEDGGVRGSANDEHRGDEGGIHVEWTKGEHQPPAYRDKWFAIAFLVHLVVILATSATLGPGALTKATSQRRLEEYTPYDATPSEDEGNTGDYSYLYDDDNSGGSSSHSTYNSSSSGNDLPEGFWIAIATISLISTPILSILALSVMSQNAILLIQLSLGVGAAVCGVVAIATFVVSPPAGLFYALMTAILVWYAKCVWHRIPYAASNLRCGIDAIRSNLGVAIVALGAVPTLVVWAGLWSLALLGTLETDWMKNQVVVEDSSSGYGGNGGSEEEISGLGVFVITLFMLSFYWTHQVIKNVVRTSVAGVVGTWWFAPLEASSFCSTAVSDSFGRATTYSLGSICFGSLIVAILHILRNSLRSASNNRRSGDIVRCIAACLLLYLERLVEYFNKWAFIYVGLYGYGYLEAGKNVMSLIKARGWTAVISDNLVNRLLSIVSLTIGLMVGVATLFVSLMFEELESKGGWLGIGFFVGFLIGIMLSSIIMGVVSSAVDAIIVCYAEAPSEFKENHPKHSAEMESTWAAAWPSLQIGGPVVVGLDGGLGFV